MSREYGVEVCSEECGATRYVADARNGRGTWRADIIEIGEIHSVYLHEFANIGNGGEVCCPACYTLVGIDADGRRWRERMVSESALEWMADNRRHGGCPAEWHIVPLPCSVDAKCHHKENREMCWAEVAVLKAAEEDGDEHADADG